MINQISFKNYKAFDEGEIKIKPITVLLGANSVGKSSIIQLLLMLQQTATSKNYKSALRLHGEFVSLGENENIFKDKDSKEKDLVLSFDFRDDNLSNLLERKILKEIGNSLKNRHQFLRSLIEDANDSEIKLNFLGPEEEEEEDIPLSKNMFMDELDEFKVLIQNYQNGSLKLNSKIRGLFLKDGQLRKIFPEIEKSSNELTKSDFSIFYDMLEKTKNLKDNLFRISFTIKNITIQNEEVLKVSSVSLIKDKEMIFCLKFVINEHKKGYSNLSIHSDYLEGKNVFSSKIKNELMKCIEFNSTLFYMFRPRDQADFFEKEFSETNIAHSIINLFYSAVFNLRKNFREELINYVSPLRAHPKRYYFLDKAKINTFLDTLDGDSLTEILKDNKNVKFKANSWLKKFNLSVDVETLKDVIHRLKVNQNGLDLDITDVGFGISQVLPVIVQGFLSRPNSLTIIEQPEIHLHPKMQADLADLFIDIIFHDKRKKPYKFLIIETHSEYFLKRLRRRIAEGKISPEHVAIYFFCAADDRSEKASNRIEEKDIGIKGDFEWPKNFYSGELLKDTTEFLKLQI